jgi:ATP-binding cassette subfamily B protein
MNPLMGKAFLVVSGIQQFMANPAKPSSSSTTSPMADEFTKCFTGSTPGGMTLPPGFNLSQLPAGMDIFTMLAKLPAESRTCLSNLFDSKFATLGEKMTIQAAAAPIKAEYTALGIDISFISAS